MPSAYTQNFYHTVFSTKHRAMLITPDLEERLYPFMGGILRDLRCTLLGVNGMPDHIHLLIRYRADLSHSDMLQQIKGRSSRWINETWPQRGHFSWQEGYGGFTIGESQIHDLNAYFAKQKEHHRKIPFETELVAFFKAMVSTRVEAWLPPAPPGRFLRRSRCARR